jgi:hypothetical protein
MPNVKEQLHDLVDQLPNNCKLEEAIYKLYILQRIRQGQDDIKAERGTPHSEVMRRTRNWLNKSSGRRGRKTI